MAVDIGIEAVDLPGSVVKGRTMVNKDHPATIAGLITSIEIWAEEDLTGLRVGTFYATNGSTLKCRDSATIGAVEAGAKRTFTEDSEENPLAITVGIGDYIGLWIADGRIERATSGYAGILYFFGEAIDPDDEETYTEWTDDVISLGGYITPPGWTTIAKASGVAQANVGKINSVSKTDIAKILGTSV